jgi:phosphonate transport system ATP-binding protein
MPAPSLIRYTPMPDKEHPRTGSTPAASAAGAAVELSGASKKFGALSVLEGLSFSIPAGQRVAIIGPSGAGKTTLLRMVCGVLWPSTGTVCTLGQDTIRLRGRSLAKLRREIGFLYQNDNLIPGLRVVHNVSMGQLARWPLPKALLSLVWPQGVKEARAALREVELEEKLWALPETLSGGQQQRVAIARLIVQQPKMMLADEPVSQLDMRLGREVILKLAALAEKFGSTLIVSLHTLDLLGTHFDRVIALKDGKLFWDGPPSGLTHAVLSDLYGAEYRALHLQEVHLVAATGGAGA